MPAGPIPGDYDPLLAKLIAWGADRGEAVARLRGALQEFDVTGIRTNTRLFLNILPIREFLQGEIHTRWLDQRLRSSTCAKRADPPQALPAPRFHGGYRCYCRRAVARNQAAAPRSGSCADEAALLGLEIRGSAANKSRAGPRVTL